MELTEKHKEELKCILASWIDEGFTTPPYTSEIYDLIEWLDIKQEDIVNGYDLERRM